MSPGYRRFASWAARVALSPGQICFYVSDYRPDIGLRREISFSSLHKVFFGGFMII